MTSTKNPNSWTCSSDRDSRFRLLSSVSSRSVCVHSSIEWLLLIVLMTWWFKLDPLLKVKVPPVFLLFTLEVRGSVAAVTSVKEVCVVEPFWIGVVSCLVEGVFTIKGIDISARLSSVIILLLFLLHFLHQKNSKK